MASWLQGHRHIPYAEVDLKRPQTRKAPGTGLRPRAGASESAERVGLASVHFPSVGPFGEKMSMVEVLETQIAQIGDEGAHAPALGRCSSTVCMGID